MDINGERITTHRAIKINFFNTLDPDFTNIMEDKKFKARSELYNLERIVNDTLTQIFKKEHIKSNKTQVDICLFGCMEPTTIMDENSS